MNANLILIFSFWLVTFLFGYFLTPYYIEFLRKQKLGKQIREEATIWKAIEFLKLHSKKAWTPTMGWWIILLTVFLMVILSIVIQQFWLINNSLLNRNETYLSLFTLFSVGLLGWIDDYMNIKWIWEKKWMSARLKMLGLILFAIMWAMWFYFNLGWNEVDSITWEYLKWLANPFWDPWKIWAYFVPLFILVIVASANSVNITDGLDGLAGGLLLFSYSVYGFICYSEWLFLLATLCLSIVGALIAFLWFNVKPAQFYMWDIGSLALWANLWIMAMLTNTIFILFIVGAIFILETVSVIVQLTSKKIRNWKKVFRIAPFHHHLEAIGWSEENVVFRLWLVGIILAISGIIFYILQV